MCHTTVNLYICENLEFVMYNTANYQNQAGIYIWQTTTILQSPKRAELYAQLRLYDIKSLDVLSFISDVQCYKIIAIYRRITRIHIGIMNYQCGSRKVSPHVVNFCSYITRMLAVYMSKLKNSNKGRRKGSVSVIINIRKEMGKRCPIVDAMCDVMQVLLIVTNCPTYHSTVIKQSRIC